MGKTQKAIEQVFIEFLKAQENNEPERLNAVLAGDVELYSGNLGNTCGIDEVKEAFRWKGTELSFARYRGFANYIRYKGDKAQQSVVVMALVDDCSEKYRPMQFSCRYYITWSKKEEGWRMQVIRSNLDWMFGPFDDEEGWFFRDAHYSAPVPSLPAPMPFEYPEYVRGWWPKFDNTSWLGHFPSEILGELDAPWIVIPEDESELTPEEEIRAVYSRYAICLETGNFRDMGNELDPDVIFYYRDPRDRAVGVRQLWRNMKDELFHAAVYEHVGVAPEITIDGDEAEMKIYRIGPREIPYRTSLPENRDYIVASNRYTINLHRVDGQWKIYQFDHMPCFDRIPFDEDTYLY